MFFANYTWNLYEISLLRGVTNWILLLFPSRTCQWSFWVATDLKGTSIWLLNLLLKEWFIILILTFHVLFYFHSINISTRLRNDSLCIAIRFFIWRILTIFSQNVFRKIYEKVLLHRNLPLNSDLIRQNISRMRLTWLESAYLTINHIFLIRARFCLHRLLTFKSL